jgi:hypothetical protein
MDASAPLFVSTQVISNADKFGAKTEDFFEDQDLLSVEDESEAMHDTPEAQAALDKAHDAFVQKSLRGGK